MLVLTENGMTNLSASVTVYYRPAPPGLQVAAASATTVAVSGSGLAGAVVNLLTNGVLAASFTNNAAGVFAGSITLPDGLYSVSAYQTTDGLASLASAAVSVTVLTVGAPTLNVAALSLRPWR